VPTVACVLKSGGGYTPEWVWALKRNVAEHLAEPHEFRVLSDLPAFGPFGIPLLHGWPGWWAKMELFRPGIFDSSPVLYLDLDTLVTGDLSELAAYPGLIAMVSDFYRPQFGQSGVMAWNPAGSPAQVVWEKFIANPASEMQRLRDDGQCIYRLLVENGKPPDRLQELYPGQVTSYKVHAAGGPPQDARLVCLHGSPKQTDPRAGWAYVEWKRLTSQPQEA
jgi:hypothetical protein